MTQLTTHVTYSKTEQLISKICASNDISSDLTNNWMTDFENFRDQLTIQVIEWAIQRLILKI